jgi:hypothetical protein
VENIKKNAICILCCQENFRKKSLPCICPRTDLPCWAIDQKCFEEENLLNLIVELDNDECNKYLDERDEPRISMHNKYIDQSFLEQIQKVYKTCDKGEK